jgi:hypothetical protein
LENHLLAVISGLLLLFDHDIIRAVFSLDPTNKVLDHLGPLLVILGPLSQFRPIRHLLVIKEPDLVFGESDHIPSGREFLENSFNIRGFLLDRLKICQGSTIRDQ